MDGSTCATKWQWEQKESLMKSVEEFSKVCSEIYETEGEKMD